MDKIRTATGKEFPSDYLSTIPSPAQTFFRVLNTPLATVAMIFSDPKETVQIWYGDEYLAQYTRLVAIAPEGDAIKVILAKE